MTDLSGSELIQRSIVIPVYRNADTIPSLLDALDDLSSQIEGLEVVFVVDGSPDESYELLREGLPDRRFRSQLLRHSRNFGSIGAVRSGLSVVRGPNVAVMAADLQEPPELIVAFFEVLDAGHHDVAVGRRVGRRDPQRQQRAANTFWWSYRKFIQPDMPEGGIDVFACADPVRRELLSMTEAHSSIVAQLVWLGHGCAEVPYERKERAGEGRSSWTLRKRIRYMLDSMFGFSNLPIRIVMAIGGIGTVLCLLVSFLVFAGWASGRINVAGYTPLMLTLLLCTSLMLSALGVVGDYVWRVYENSKGRPLSVVDRIESF